MALLVIFVLGLLGSGIASAEEIGKNIFEELGAIRRHQHDVNQGSRTNESRQRISEIIESDFEIGHSAKPWHGYTAVAEEHFARVKRAPARDPECETAAGKKLFWDGGENVLLGMGNPIADQDSITAPIPKERIPERCLSKRQQELSKLLRSSIRTGMGRNAQEESYKLNRSEPSQYITEYVTESNKTKGCRCRYGEEGLSCVCCFYWMYFDIVFCAGCAYSPPKALIIVELTAEDHVILKWTKNVTKNKLTEFLQKFSKPVCYEKQWKIFKIKLCVKLFGVLDLSFEKVKPSKLSLCVQLTGYLLFFDLTLYEPPCWELIFDVTGKDERQIGGPGDSNTAQLTWEQGKKDLSEPIKIMFATEHLEDIGKRTAELWKEDSEAAKAIIAKGGSGKIVQNAGEDPKILKTGTPTTPINWGSADVSKLDYLVVLYTDPLPSPLNMNDEEGSEIPGFKSLIQEGMSRKTVDPKYSNLKVEASMGKTCGGVALTPGKILTLCACIEYFYLYHKKQKRPKLTGNDPFTLKSSEIYVTYAQRGFTADQMVYELDQNVNNFMKKSKCFDAIDNTVDSHIFDMHLHMVVMPVTPELKRFDTLKLTPWIDMTGGAKTPIPVEMTVIGMEKREAGTDLFDASGTEMDPVFEAFKVPFETCTPTVFCSKSLDPSKDEADLPKDFRENTNCFCARNKDFQLCDGVLGFPVVTKKGLIGLNTLPMDCKQEGSMVTTLLSKDVIREIDDYVQGHAPHHYGSATLAKSLMMIIMHLRFL